MDLDLETRIVALAARAPGETRPPSLVRPARARRLVASLAVAPVLALAMTATVAAGVAVVALNIAHGYPGIENPGQPLAGANMECMTPPGAAAFLTSRGYTGVVWQVESTDPDAADAKASITTIVSSPPEHGFVIPGSVLDDGVLHMVIDQRVGAQGAGDCFGRPMP